MLTEGELEAPCVRLDVDVAEEFPESLQQTARAKRTLCGYSYGYSRSPSGLSCSPSRPPVSARGK